MTEPARKRTVKGGTAKKVEVDPAHEFLKLEEAAALLRISRHTAKNLALAGELPGAFKLGKQWRISRKMLDEHLTKPVRRANPKVRALFPRPEHARRPGRPRVHRPPPEEAP